MRWRRRQPEPVAVEVECGIPQSESAAPVAPPEPKTAAEIANDRIIAKQLAVAERERELVRVRAEAKAQWLANRSPEQRLLDLGGMDYSRFVF
ncbi:MAG TPA: hypothetical protein VH108_09170 [Gaiellaceae bacterium]|jgi:hypothetical protein|nr:hypothetical protein [Gaiellaceae bacterium]